MNIRVGFVTCVRLGLECMEEIYSVGGNLDLVITLPDDRAREKSGRVYLDQFCSSKAIPLLKSPHINDASVIDRIRESGIDWLFIVGWSQIAGPDAIAAPRRGALGMHPTLLPEGRGRAAIPWAILKGLGRTGVTLFKLDNGVDTGPIVAQEVIKIDPEETASTLYRKVTHAHRALIGRVWPDLMRDRLELRAQDSAKATVWPGRKPQDGLIDGAVMTVAEIDLLVRAVTKPYPGAFAELPEGRLRIWAGCPDRPAEDKECIPIPAIDGLYYATDFVLE